MRYSIHEGFYRVWRVTGPTHNLLGLAFTEESVEEFVPADTPDDKVYSYLARMIVERLANGADFERT